LVALATPAAGSPGGKWPPAEVPRVEIRGPVETKSKAGPLDALAAIASLVTASIALLAAGVAWFEYESGRKENRGERTAKFVERYTSRDFQNVVSPTLSFLRVQTTDDCIKKLEAHDRRRHADDACLPRAKDRPDGPKASYNDLYQVFYFFEDMAVAYNRGELSKAVVHETFPGPPVQIFTEAWWYLRLARSGEWVQPERKRRSRVLEAGETDLFSQFEWMVREIQSKVSEERNTFPDVNDGFVLTVPPTEPRDDAREWSRARIYSRLLTKHVQDLDAALESLEDKAEGPCPTAKLHATSTHETDWEVVIVPPRTEEERTLWEERRERSRRLAHCLTVLEHDEILAAIPVVD
jgi:hypothetical protein